MDVFPGQLLVALMFSLSEEPAIGKVVANLKLVHDRVDAIQARYELVREPTAKFLGEYARDTKKGLDEVRGQFSERLLCDWAEKRSGERFLDVTAFDQEGQRKYHRLLAYDLREYWTLNYLSDIEFPVTEVTIGRDNSSEFQDCARFTQLCGWTVTVSYPKALFRCIEESTNSEIAVRDPLADSEWIKVRAAVPLTTVAVLAWLDPDRDMAIRELQHQLLNQGSWVTTQTHRVTNLRLLRDERGNPTTLWCPEQGTTEILNGRGEVTLIEHYKLIDAKLNPTLPAAKFTPTIEVGSNMRDARTGRLWVHGDRASPEIEKLVAERVKQAKAQLGNAGATSSVSRPGSWATLLACGSAALGIVGLGVAVLLWWQTRR
jgi:hypothetical protein